MNLRKPSGKKNGLKILAPVRDCAEIDALADAGADELYCGVLSKEWKRLFTAAASPNRVERSAGNLDGFEKLAEVVDGAHERDLRVCYCLNGLFSLHQYERLLERETIQALDTGVDAIIVADPGVLLYIHEIDPGLEIHISTGGSVFNTETALFFTRLGVGRVILPRSLGREEVCRLAGNLPGVSLEVIVKNGGCMNEDGLCTFHHGLTDEKSGRKFIDSPAGRALFRICYRIPKPFRDPVMGRVLSNISGNGCSLPYKVNSLPGMPAEPQKKRLIRKRLRAVTGRAWSHAHVCGACAIPAFLKAGIDTVKIVGRTFPLERKVVDITFIKAIIEEAGKKGVSPADFTVAAKQIHLRIYGYSCGDNCYYPEAEI